MQVTNNTSFRVLAFTGQDKVGYSDDVVIDPGQTAEVPPPYDAVVGRPSNHQLFGHHIVCHEDEDNDHGYHVSLGQQLCLGGDDDATIVVRHHSEDRQVKRVLTRAGEPLYVNTTFCGRFGFEYRQRVRCVTNGKEGVVIGVGRLPGGKSTPCMSGDKELLWVLLDGEPGVSFSPDPASAYEKI